MLQRTGELDKDNKPENSAEKNREPKRAELQKRHGDSISLLKENSKTV